MILKPYVKVNPLVAEDCGLSGARSRTADGNYILFKRDLLRYGSLFEIDRGDVLQRLGALPMSTAEASAEQQGRVRTELPVPTDERFRLPLSSLCSDHNEEEEGADHNLEEGGER